MAILEIFSDISLSVWIVAIITFLLAYHYMSRPSWKLPPGPPNLPIIGSLPFIRGDLRHVLARMQQKYGDVFIVHVGAEKTVILNGYATIKEALFETKGSFDGRSVNHFKDMSNNLGIITSQGPLWKEQRRYLLHALRDFGLGKKGMEDIINDECEHLVAALAKHSGGEPYDLRFQLHEAVSNVIMTIVKGERFEYEDPEMLKSLDDIVELLKLIGTDNPVWVFPILKYIPGDFFGYRKCREILLRLRTMYHSWIDDHRAAMDQGDQITDLIGCYITEMEKKKDKEHYFSDDNLVQIIIDIFVAGTDTTGNTLAFAVIYMMSHPQIQAKMHDEIDDVIGRDRRPEMSDKVHMPYTEAILSEVQRIANVVPLAVPHGAMTNAEFHGYTIPEQSTVIVNLHSILWDPKIFPNPEKFDPNRFIGEDGSYKSREEMIPFSFGKRACLGEGLARMELFIVLVSIFQKYRFTVPEGQPIPDNNGILGLTYHPKPFSVSIHHR